jgi:hypothetical protein
MESPRTSLIENCVVRSGNGREIDLEAGLALGRLFVEKRNEMRGPGTRGDFTRWFESQGYSQRFVSVWMRRARTNWHPVMKCKTRKDKGKGLLAANNGAAYRASAPQGFIASPPGKDLASFEVHGARFNPVAMAVPAGLSEKEWMDVGRKLATVQGSSLFWVGDWIDAGAEQFGKRIAYNLAQSATGMGRGSLYTYHTVSRRFSPARRVAELTFKHHQIVGTPRLTHAQQDELLRDAVRLGLSPKQLHEEVVKIIGKKPRRRIRLGVYLWPETFVKMKELAQGKRPEWFAAEIITDWVLKNHAAKMRAEAADTSNIHGLAVTDSDLPDFSQGEPDAEPTTVAAA